VSYGVASRISTYAEIILPQILCGLSQTQPRIKLFGIRLMDFVIVERTSISRTMIAGIFFLSTLLNNFTCSRIPALPDLTGPALYQNRSDLPGGSNMLMSNCDIYLSFRENIEMRPRIVIREPMTISICGTDVWSANINPITNTISPK
jgi:hypothetical protein